MSGAPRPGREAAAMRAAAIADEARERAAGLAVAVVDGDDVAIQLDPGADPLTESTRFDIGSVDRAVMRALRAS